MLFINSWERNKTPCEATKTLVPISAVKNQKPTQINTLMNTDSDICSETLANPIQEYVKMALCQQVLSFILPACKDGLTCKNNSVYFTTVAE